MNKDNDNDYVEIKLPEKQGVYPHYTFNECCDACRESILNEPESYGAPPYAIAISVIMGAITLYYELSIKGYFLRMKYNYMIQKLHAKLLKKRNDNERY